MRCTHRRNGRSPWWGRDAPGPRWQSRSRARGWVPVAVAGRAPEARSVRTAAERLGAEAREVADAGRGAELVILATPDAAIADAAAALAPGLEPGALVLHLSGACALDELDKLGSRGPMSRWARCTRSNPSRRSRSACRASSDRGARSRARRRSSASPYRSACVRSEWTRRRAPATTRPRRWPRTTSSRCWGRRTALRAMPACPPRHCCPSCAPPSTISRRSGRRPRSRVLWHAAMWTPCGATSTRFPPRNGRPIAALAGIALQLTGRERPELVEVLREEVP